VFHTGDESAITEYKEAEVLLIAFGVVDSADTRGINNLSLHLFHSTFDSYANQ
jgi:hypothetical protein